jgi:hypothetical protein
MIGAVEVDIEKGRLFLCMAAQFGQFIDAVGGSFLFSLALAFSFVALLLLARLLFLTFIER